MLGCMPEVLCWLLCVLIDAGYQLLLPLCPKHLVCFTLLDRIDPKAGTTYSCFAAGAYTLIC